MAANNLKGLTVEIGGDTKGLAEALNNVNGDINNLQANLRTVNSALKLDPSNVEAVAMKHDLLTQAVEATREKLDTLREAQRQADEQIANGVEVDERAYQNLQAEIVRASSSLTDYKRQLIDMADAAEEAENSLDDLSDTTDDADENLDDVADAAQEAADKFEELADSAGEGIDRMSTGFGNLASGVGTAVTAVTGAFAAVSGALLYASESTEEYRINMAKLETAFVEAGSTAETASQMYTSFFGFLGDEGQATEAAAHLAQLTNDQKALSEWTTIAAGVYATFGDSLPIENLTEASNETAKTGQLTGGLADALNWAGVNEEEFQAKLDACRSSQEREALIRETLNGIYTEAGEKYQENAADLIASNEAQARYTDAMAAFGEKAQPILTAVRNGFAMLLEAASGLIENVDMDAITVAIENAFKWFLETAVPAIKEAIQWVIDHKELIIGMITAIGAGFVAWNVVQIVSGAIQAFTSFTSALKIAKTAFSALDLAMKANVIGIVITAVAALVSAFIYLWNNCEEFRNFWINLWNQIKGILEPIWNAIVAVFQTAWENIKIVWDVVVSYFTTLWENIKLIFGVVGDVLSGNFSDAWEKIKQIFANWGEFFSGVWIGIQNVFSGVGNWFSEKFTEAKNLAQNAWDGVTGFFSNVREGINQSFENVGNWFSEKFTQAKDLAQKAWAGAKEHFSTVKEGITDAFSTVDGFMSDKFGGAWTAVKKVFQPAVDFFKQIWESIKGVFSAVKSVLSGNFSEAWESIKGIFSGWGNFFSGLWDKMKNAFTNVGQLGKDIVRGLWNGINDMVGWIGEKIRSFGESVLSGIKNFFGIKSPSTVMRDQVGRDLARGVGVGVEENADEALDPMENLVSDMSGINIDRNISNTFRGTTSNEFGGLSERLDAVVDYLSKYLPNLAENASRGIYLDGDTLVGSLGDRIDAELAKQYNRKGRGQ